MEVGWHHGPPTVTPQPWAVRGTQLPGGAKALACLWRGADGLAGPPGRPLSAANQNLRSSHKPKGSKPNWPEEQTLE